MSPDSRTGPEERAAPAPVRRDEPLRVLVLAPHPFLEHRGTPLAVRALVEALSERGCIVDVLTYEHGEDVEIPRCTIHRTPSPFGVRDIRPGFSMKKLISDVAMFRQLIRLLRRNRYDVIHAVEESAFMAAITKRWRRIPFVYDMDSSLAQQMVEKLPVLVSVRPLLELAERWAIRESAGVVAVCRSIEDTVREHAPGKLVARVEDASLLDPAVEGEEQIRDVIGQSGPVAMYVGNLEPYQGIDLLIDAFRHALGTVPDAQLVVLGGAAADVTRYRRVVADLGISRSVHLLGPRPVTLLGWYLRQADVLVSPRTRGYNTPMKIYSYLDSGRPVLATRLLTHTQVLDDGIALLAEPTAAAMGAGLIRLLSDTGLREELGAAARERVRAEYSQEAFRRKVHGFYDALERTLPTRAQAGGTRSVA
jgi:glycosyltransferase involved in cell wall biosynthesis